jgi:YVTN family beta-propeller protein
VVITAAIAVIAITLFVFLPGSSVSLPPIINTCSRHHAVNTGQHPIALSTNPPTNKIYVANYDDNTVSVIDGKTNRVINIVNVGKNPYSVAVNPNTNTVYITNKNYDTVSIIKG